MTFILLPTECTPIGMRSCHVNTLGGPAVAGRVELIFERMWGDHWPTLANPQPPQRGDVITSSLA
jgi:hypothetical protein